MLRRRTFVVLSLAVIPVLLPRFAASQAPLRLVEKLEMPASVQGKFDHLGIDEKGSRLFVAAESTHQVLVFDLKSRKYVRSIPDIQIPHAVFVREDLNRIYITDGGAGALKVFDGRTYALLKSIPLKLDADSISYDTVTHYLYIDNGGGDAHETFSTLSVVDTTRDTRVADVKIDGDTLEAMAIEENSGKMYVNDAALNKVVVLDRRSHSIVANWPVTMGKRNVAMALDEAGHRLFVGSRSGAISVFDTGTGKELTSLPIGAGVDDMVFDAGSKHLYATCGGDGLIYVYQQRNPDHYELAGKVPSGPKGKNALLSRPRGRFYVIVPPQASTPGAVYVFAVQS